MNVEKSVQWRALLLLGLRKAHEYVHVALIGIHADEVFSNPKAAAPPKLSECSSFSTTGFSDCVVEATTRFKGKGSGTLYETSSAWPVNAPAFPACPPSMAARSSGATWMYLCGLIKRACADAAHMKKKRTDK